MRESQKSQIPAHELSSKLRESAAVPTWLHSCPDFTVLCLCASVREPCEERNGGCAQLCGSEGDLVRCSCRPGFILAGDGSNCEGEELCTHLQLD